VLVSCVKIKYVSRYPVLARLGTPRPYALVSPKELNIFTISSVKEVRSFLILALITPFTLTWEPVRESNCGHYPFTLVLRQAMRIHSIVAPCLSGIRNMIRLIKYDVQRCLFPFLVAVFLPHFLYSFRSF
jgi:hypothetical protein